MSTGDPKNERPLASKPLSADAPEERLIQRCLAGDETAWERLYRKYHPRLRRAVGSC